MSIGPAIYISYNTTFNIAMEIIFKANNSIYKQVEKFHLIWKSVILDGIQYLSFKPFH